MGLIDKLRRAGGIIKNRFASAVGALRGVARGVTVGVPTRVRRGVRFGVRAGRLTSPVGLGLTAVAFAPEIARGVRVAGRAIGRGVAFFGGRQVVTAAAAGGVAGVLGTRKSGRVTRPSDFGDPRLQTRRPTAAERRRIAAGGPVPQDIAERGFKAARPRVTRRRVPNGTRKKRRAATRRARVSRKRKRRTHRSPRHKGHKLVKFTTKEGKKVSFLVNPRARHR